MGHKCEKLAKWYEYAAINPGVNKPSNPRYEIENIVKTLNFPIRFKSTPKTHLRMQ